MRLVWWLHATSAPNSIKCHRTSIAMFLTFNVFACDSKLSPTLITLGLQTHSTVLDGIIGESPLIISLWRYERKRALDNSRRIGPTYIELARFQSYSTTCHIIPESSPPQETGVHRSLSTDNSRRAYIYICIFFILCFYLFIRRAQNL